MFPTISGISSETIQIIAELQKNLSLKIPLKNCSVLKMKFWMSLSTGYNSLQSQAATKL